MEKYDVLNVVGEGSYGMVMRCRHRDSGQYVAIKKFLETDDDPSVKKMAVREICMLKKLRHENLVNMLEVFRKKKRFFIVFEYLEHTILEELEAKAGGLGFIAARKYTYQILRALDYIHSQNVIHRDIKPENILVSRLGVVKLCDFGFARIYSENKTFTDYVATRWYRSPELLVGDPRYGKEIDIWAIGCLYAEMLTGEPLFAGESDIDQLFQIVRVLGKLTSRHQALITQNSPLKSIKQEQNTTLLQMFPEWNRHSLDFLVICLKMDGVQRPRTSDLLRHQLFVKDNFLESFLPDLRTKIDQEMQSNPLSKRIGNFLSPNNKYSMERTKSKPPDVRNKTLSYTYNNNNNSKTNNLNNGSILNVMKKSQGNHRTNACLREKTSKISLLSLTGNKYNFGNDEQIAPFRHYLPNNLSKQISINNLVFREDDKSPRILSGKLQNMIFEQFQTSSPTQIIPPPSPNSLPLPLQQPVKPNPFEQQQSTAVANRTSLASSFAGQLTGQLNTNNLVNLQQMQQCRVKKSFTMNSRIPLKTNFQRSCKNINLNDANVMPSEFVSYTESLSNISPRILPLTSWPAVNQKPTNTKKFLTNKQGVVDWRNLAREQNDTLFPHCPPSSSPYKGNKKKLSPMSNSSFQNRTFDSPVSLSLTKGAATTDQDGRVK